MFTKLLKYEFKATTGILGVLSLAALGVGLLGSISLRILLHLTLESVPQAVAATIGIVFCVFLLIGCVLAIIAYAIGGELLLLNRFYTNKFTDEGYLTFTLPVSSHQILLSSLVNLALWTLIMALVICVDAALLLLLGFSAADSAIFSELLRAFRIFFQSLADAMSLSNAGYTVLSAAGFLCGAAKDLVVPTLAITIGALAAKKHKLLAAFGVFFGIELCVNIITGAAAAISILITVQTETVSTFLFTGLPIIFDLAIALGGYFLMHYLVSKKLNLP